MKKKVFIIFIVITSLLVVLLFIDSKINLSRNGEIVSIHEMDDLNTLDGYYYFGRPDCLACRTFQKELDDFIATNEISIQYINTSYFKNEYAGFKEFLMKENIDTVPVMIYYNSNIEVKRIIDEKQIRDFFK